MVCLIILDEHFKHFGGLDIFSSVYVLSLDSNSMPHRQMTEWRGIYSLKPHQLAVFPTT